MKKPGETVSPSTLDVQSIRAQFPILSRQVHGKPLVYFDNAATTQKPLVVIDTLNKYYREQNANIHRGVHALSQEATSAYEAVRQKIAHFINAAEARQIIFTRGATESINLVAATWGRKFLTAGDEIILSEMEHHSNIVPWQMLAEQTEAVIRVVPIDDSGALRMDEFDRLLSDRTKIVSIVHLSNSLGTVNPVKEIIAKAHARGAVVMVDGAQWVAHAPLDVQDLDVDFYAFSGHKLYGPTGIGVLYGKAKLLESMPPYQGGGDMISSVSFAKTTYNVIPHKFEAGTPHIAGVIGLGAAIDFVQSVGLEKIAAHEQSLLRRATQAVSEIPGVRIVGTAPGKAGVVSFVVENPPISTLDIGMKLDAEGIAVRTGHHCCQPVMDRLGISSTARISLAVYNTPEEIDFVAAQLRKIVAGAPKMSPPPAPSQGSMQFPPAAGSSPRAVADELAEAFEFLGDWNERYRYLIELGGKLASMPAELKTEATRVHGCMSLVHLYARRVPGAEDRLEFLASSDADIVRGLLAVLQKLFSGQSARTILDFDTEAFLKRLGLDENLIMGRRIGLASMIQRIRGEAEKIVSSESRQVLPVLPNSGKVEQLKSEPAAPKPPPPMGHPMHESPPDLLPAQRAMEATIVEVLRTVYDPEIPVNIYDLGLIYRIDIDAKNNVKVRMTLTTPACPVAGSLPGTIEQKIESIPQVASADIELVWEPPWDKSRMSEAAMLDLGLF
jgi:cysteine desulfurase/selenocysteine lyase